jgi:hypothetical protein
MAIASRSNEVEFVHCWIGMTNHGATVSYSGYGKDSPTYSVVYERSTGSITQNLFWCGTGLRQVTLGHNEGVQFMVLFPPTNAPARIVLDYKYPSLVERLLARAPYFVRNKLPARPYYSVALPLSEELTARETL